MEGPSWLIRLGEIGTAGGFLILLITLPKRSPFGYPWLALTGLLLNGAAILLGTGLDRLLIHPDRLPNTPALNATYHDPSGNFRMRVPADWTAAPGDRGTMGTSIDLEPGIAEKTAGIAQLSVVVQPLQGPITDTAQALNVLTKWVKTAGDLSNGKNSQDIRITPERITLPDGSPALHIKVEAMEWWVPVREDVLYAVRPGRFLCMISAAGLSAYASLYEPFCVRLYETIETPG